MSQVNYTASILVIVIAVSIVNPVENVSLTVNFNDKIAFLSTGYIHLQVHAGRFHHVVELTSGKDSFRTGQKRHFTFFARYNSSMVDYLQLQFVSQAVGNDTIGIDSVAFVGGSGDVAKICSDAGKTLWLRDKGPWTKADCKPPSVWNDFSLNFFPSI